MSVKRSTSAESAHHVDAQGGLGADREHDREWQRWPSTFVGKGAPSAAAASAPADGGVKDEAREIRLRSWSAPTVSPMRKIFSRPLRNAVSAPAVQYQGIVSRMYHPVAPFKAPPRKAPPELRWMAIPMKAPPQHPPMKAPPAPIPPEIQARHEALLHGAPLQGPLGFKPPPQHIVFDFALAATLPPFKRPPAQPYDRCVPK